MENLQQNLQRTIRALETLSEKGHPEVELVDELLDQLFQQKIDLVNMTTNPSAPAYQQASQALAHAATRAEKAGRDAAHFKDMVAAVKDAITKLAKLLSNFPA
jgi:Asp-tRNA(Asn)/Glu-tRNA(Gln) amidotransferase A subunit family amidase